MIKDINGHSPLPDNIYIEHSPIHGMGLFAKKDIGNGWDFGITHVADDRFADGYIRTPFGGFINHSLSPNCEVYEVDDTLHMRTIQDIPKDSELTIDYRPYYSEAELKGYKD